MWKKMMLGDICDIFNGGTPNSKEKAYWGEGLQWLTPKDMGKMKTRSIAITERQITKSGLANSSAKLIPENAVILSCRAPIGHVAINEVPMSFNQGCKGLVPKDELLTEFLYYFLISSKKLLNKLGSGTTFKEISGRTLANVEILVPPLPEQQRIVAKLDDAFAEIDKVEQISTTSQKTYPHLSRKIISQCLSNRNYNWTKKYLNQISINLDSKRKPITKSKRIKGKVPYYGASGIVDYVDGYIFDDDLLLISEDGANLLSRSYPIAFSIKGRTWVNNHAHVLKFNSNSLQLWVEMYLNFKNIDDYISGMAQPKLNQAKLNQIPIPVPEENKLKEILEIIHTAKEIIKKAQANRIMKLELLKNLKSSILSKELGKNTL